MTRKELFFLALLFVAAFVAVASLSGCRTTVTGGQSRHDTGSLSVTYDRDRVVISDTRESIATTQPSTETNTGQMPQIGASKEGETGSISFEQAKENAISGRGYVVGIVCVLIAIGVWFLTRRIWPSLFIALFGIGVALLPLWAGILCLLLPLGALVYLAWHNQSQVVAGVSNGLSTLPTVMADTFKSKMAEKHDDATKRAVRAAKPL